MEKSGLSLRQVAHQAGISPAFLSRLLREERGLPSDEIIESLAHLLQIDPPEDLLLAAGRTPKSIKHVLTKPEVFPLLRTLSPLSDQQRQEICAKLEKLAKQYRKTSRTS